MLASGVADPRATSARALNLRGGRGDGGHGLRRQVAAGGGGEAAAWRRRRRAEERAGESGIGTGAWLSRRGTLRPEHVRACAPRPGELCIGASAGLQSIASTLD